MEPEQDTDAQTEATVTTPHSGVIDTGKYVPNLSESAGICRLYDYDKIFCCVFPVHSPLVTSVYVTSTSYGAQKYGRIRSLQGGGVKLNVTSMHIFHK